MNVLCSQFGARQNYEIPKRLSETQELSLLVTDFWNPLGDILNFRHKIWPSALRRAGSRCCPGIPSSNIRIDLRVAFAQTHMPKSGAERGEEFARLFADLARFTAKCARRVEHDRMFAFCGAALEALEEEKALGLISVLDQYDTGLELEQTIESETIRFREFGQQVMKLPGWYYERLREEWRIADRIIVNSSWTRQSLLRSGVPAEKIIVIPLSIPPLSGAAKPKRRGNRNLRVLWLGRLCLGKGLAYAIETARRVRSLPIDFTFVGASCVDQNAIDWPENCKVQRHVPRNEVDQLYANHDVFLFPTLSDGFGRVQLEAIQHGLVLIATDCCGEVVEHERSGFLVEPRNAAEIADRLALLALSKNLLEEMSECATERATQFAPDRIWPLNRAALMSGQQVSVETGCIQ